MMITAYCRALHQQHQGCRIHHNMLQCCQQGTHPTSRRACVGTTAARKGRATLSQPEAGTAGAVGE
jgi:hypothetical protein